MCNFLLVVFGTYAVGEIGQFSFELADDFLDHCLASLVRLLLFLFVQLPLVRLLVKGHQTALVFVQEMDEQLEPFVVQVDLSSFRSAVRQKISGEDRDFALGSKRDQIVSGCLQNSD